MPLSGARNKGTLYIYGTKDGDHWVMRRVYVAVNERRIMLVGAADEPPPDGGDKNIF